MDPIFRNKYIVSANSIREFYKITAPLWKTAIWYPLLILVGGMFMYLRFDGIHELIYAAVMAVYTFLLIIRWKESTQKLTYNRYLINKLENLERVVEFADDITVIVPSTGSQSVYSYEHVYQFYESRNLYVLMLPYQTGIILEKGKFTVGDEEAFPVFIKNKCVHLKLKK